MTSPSPLVNAIADPHIIFRGGNLLDIQLAADPQANPKRKTPAAGDVRILVSRRGGKPLAVVFRPQVKGFKGRPVELTSPTGKETFESIATSDRVQMEHLSRGAGGFEATVTIPLDLIGLSLRPGAPVRMDVGYVFGNRTGTQAAMRAYWSNNSFTANVINDIPHESRLEPHEWGTAAVE